MVVRVTATWTQFCFQEKMVIMNPIMCQAVLEDEGSMGNKANNHNNNNNNKISESLSSQSCPLGRRTHCQRQRLIAPGVCQACSHLNAIVSATPSARSTSPHSFPWPTLRSHLLQEALSDHPVWSSPCQSLSILFPHLICFVPFITGRGPLVYSICCLLKSV